jgi:HK97 family phage major capsid protein
MYELKEMKEKRAALVHQQKDLFERAKKEGRNLTTDENDQFERMESDFAEISRSITNSEKMVEILGKQASQQEARQEQESAPEYRATFSKYLRRGTGGLNDLERGQLIQNRGTDPQTTTDAAGGYTIPEGFSNELFVEMALWGGMLQAARVVRTTSGNPILGLP